MKRSWPGALFIALFSTAACASGGYVGPSASPPVHTVAGALEAPDDTQAVVQGKILKWLKGEHYEFKDATGSMIVEIDDELWPATPVSERATVKLTGEVEREFFRRTLDVESLELMN